MKKKFLALVVGATLCSLVVSGVASASCVSVTVNPSDSNMWISFDSACGSYQGTLGSKQSYNISSGATIGIYKDHNDFSIGATPAKTEIVPTIKTNDTLKTATATATLDCSKGVTTCNWPLPTPTPNLK